MRPPSALSDRSADLAPVERSTSAAARIGVTAQCIRDLLKSESPLLPGLIAGSGKRAGYFINVDFVDYVVAQLKAPGVRVLRLEDLAREWNSQRQQSAAASQLTMIATPQLAAATS